jgi:hypothetical protein
MPGPIDQLREIFRREGQAQPTKAGWPDVAHPSWTLPPIEQIGVGPKLGATISELEHQVPDIKRQIRTITTAPDQDTLDEYLSKVQSSIEPRSGWISAVTGTAPRAVGSRIHVNPAMENQAEGAMRGRAKPSSYLMPIITHEAGHQYGSEHPDIITDLVEQFGGKPTTGSIEALTNLAYPFKR